MPETAPSRTPTVAAAEAARETWPVAPAETYPRRPPTFVNAELVEADDLAALRRHWDGAAQQAPALVLHRLGEATVAFPGVVRLPDGRVVADSLHNMPAARKRDILAAPLPRRAPQMAPDGPVLLLARAGSVNYGHWLVEHLGALLLLRAAMPGLRPRLLVNDRRGGAMWRVLETSARLAGLDEAALLPLGGAPLRVPDLLMFSPASAHPHMKHPAVVGALAALAPPGPAEERLFVRRTNTAKRVLHNLDEVEAAAARLGFRMIEPGRMTLEGQIVTFGRARIVAGVSGADLTNIAFMPHGGEVVCMLPSRGRNLFFWDVCCLRGLRYWSVFGPAVTQRGGGHDDFTVDARLAAEVMARAVAGG
jgi:capsular polysaccharide biosynthesis protein